MSTPKTAVATLPPYHHHRSHPHNSHHHTHHYQVPSTSSTITATSTATIPASTYRSGVAASHLHPSQGSFTAGQHSPGSTGMAAAAAAPDASDDQGHSRKRRRSREPDWNNFYRNGLPKEVIVIDDTPEPEANTGRKLANGHAANHAVVAATDVPPVPAYERYPVKRRRQNDGAAAAPAAPATAYHVQYADSHSTPLSSDRTNSAQHTTAPTSLSSSSQYSEAAAPLKRKRTTRQQVANEAKRREVDSLGGLLTYKPPPFPPKKVSGVHVRVVPDVSIKVCDGGVLTGQHSYSKSLKLDDDDGHYIVVPDADLTEKCMSAAGAILCVLC